MCDVRLLILYAMLIISIILIIIENDKIELALGGLQFFLWILLVIISGG